MPGNHTKHQHKTGQRPYDRRGRGTSKPECRRRISPQGGGRIPNIMVQQRIRNGSPCFVYDNKTRIPTIPYSQEMITNDRAIQVLLNGGLAFVIAKKLRHWKQG